MKLPNIWPGPWLTDEDHHTELYQNIKVKSDSHTVCEFCIDDAPVPDYNEMQQATAKAILVLPGLLKTLEKAKWMLERDYIDAQKMAIIRECRQILLKAGCRED